MATNSYKYYLERRFITLAMEATHDEKEKNNNEYLFTKVINIEEQNEDYNPTKKINNNSNSINNINSISSTNRLSNNQMMLEVDNNDINQESFHNRKRKAFYTICLSFVLFFGGLVIKRILLYYIYLTMIKNTIGCYK